MARPLEVGNNDVKAEALLLRVLSDRLLPGHSSLVTLLPQPGHPAEHMAALNTVFRSA